MDPSTRVSWDDLLAEYRRRNQREGLLLVEPSKDLLFATCRQLGIHDFNSRGAVLTGAQREQILNSFAPEHQDESAIDAEVITYKCEGFAHRRDVITNEPCDITAEKEEDLTRTSPYGRLLCPFHLNQACHITFGHLLSRLMADLGEELFDDPKWRLWLANCPDITPDAYFLFPEELYEQVHDYVRREPTPPEPPPSVDAPAPPDSDPPDDDSPEPPPVQDPELATVVDSNPSEGGPAVTDYLDEAKKGLPSRSDEAKAFVADLKRLIAAGQHHNPNLKVVAVVNGKVVGDSDDLVDAITPIVKHLDTAPAEEVYVRDADALTNLLAPLVGDEDPTKKAVKTAWNA